MLKEVVKPLIYLRFLDHSSGAANEVKPIVCELFGILKKEDDVSYQVVSWICDFNLNDSNSDGYCILKSAVLEYREIDTNGGRTYGKANAKGFKKRTKANQKGSKATPHTR